MVEYAVSEISRAIKSSLEGSFNNIRISGEVSGYKMAASGHLYFNLKDEKAVLRAVCWKGIAAKMLFILEDGMQVICTGSISIYEGGSYYQIIATKIEAAGVGVLLKMLEKRKQQLAAEGLFDANRKQLLPFLPRTIAVVTSPSGAVILDILHRITERFPTRVLLVPVMVQGVGAAAQIAETISNINQLGGNDRPDLIIVARGGGSIEDLWLFNEEVVVRAAAASNIPLISAIGHETDFTLIDYAADLRAPTPTAAAEIAVPVKTQLYYKLNIISQKADAYIVNCLKKKELALRAIKHQLNIYTKHLDNLELSTRALKERISISVNLLLRERGQRLSFLKIPISVVIRDLSIKEGILKSILDRVRRAIANAVREKDAKLISTIKLIESYNYKAILNRGFALVRSQEGNVITSVTQLQVATTITVELKDGIERIKVIIKA